MIATGYHRGTTKNELVSKFGAEIVEKENIYIGIVKKTAHPDDR
jgi:nickel-dependent lactate racemase